MGDPAELWRSAAASCARFAASLSSGEEIDAANVEQLREALDKLKRVPGSAPTADFLREASAAATAAASLAASAKSAPLPADENQLLQLWGCWSTTGSAVLALQRSVVGGCLRLLPVRQAYSLSSALLMFTDGLPTLLLALQQQWAAAPAQRPAWPVVICRLAHFAGDGLATVLGIVSDTLACEATGAGEIVPGATTAAAVARLLRGTTVRPALVLAALDGLAQAVEPHAAAGWDAPETEAGEAVARWLKPANTIVSLTLFEPEREGLLRMPGLQRRAAHLAADCIERCLLPIHQDEAMATRQEHATNVLFSPCVLPYSCPLLGVLGVGDTGQLVPSVQQRLEAALADGTAFESADAALHALRLAAFAAEAMQHVGLAAGVEPDPLPQPPAARALLEQARLPALQQLSSAARAQVQAQLLLTAMQLVPAVVGVGDALLQHGMLQAGPQCSSLHSRKVLLLGSFLMWLGRSAAATAQAFSPQAPIGDAIASIARTWLLVQTRLLQLHAAYPSATGSSGSSNSSSGGGGGNGSSQSSSSSNSSSGGGGGNGSSQSSSSSHLAGLQSLLSGLSQCSRGLTELNGQLQLAARAAVLAESSAAAGSGAGAAGQHPLLPTMRQLVTTASITAHLAAGLPQFATDAAAQQVTWHLLACSPGEPPVVRGADLIGSAMTGLLSCLKGPWSLPEDADGRPAAAALDVGWQLAPVLLEAAAAGAALVGAMESLPEVAAAKSSGQPAPVRLGRPLYSLAASMPMIISLAHECGQAAAGAEAERVLGRTLRLLAELPGETQQLVASWSLVLSVRPTTGCELVASGALDAALDWAARREAQAAHLLTSDVVPGVNNALVEAVIVLAPLPEQPSPAPSASALLAAALEHVQQQLGVSGDAARAAAWAVACNVAGRSSVPAAQRRALTAQLTRQGGLGWAAGDPVRLRAMAAALLAQLKPLAVQHVAPGSAVAQQLALERCYALGQRRCAHLGCTNIPLLLGAGAGGSGQAGRSRKCTGCRSVRFCSEACSRADWRVHKQACRQLAAA